METAKIVSMPYTGEVINKLLIRLHLLKMELYLKLVSTDNLNDTQKNNRTKVISVLKHYRQQNNFPTRDDGPSEVRLPRFVGSNNVPCAMGYILQQTGEMNLYNEISTKNNDVYVEDIQSSDYDKWLLENGMTKDETAAIQPGYRGTSTTVYEIINPLYLWGITIAISCLILLYALLLINRIALKQPVKIISIIMLTIVSFFLGFNITHYLLKKHAPSSLIEICEYEVEELREPYYSPAGCEDKINRWTPSKTETTESYNIGPTIN